MARAITAIATVVAIIIAAGIILIVLGAKPSTEIVKWIEDAARWLTTPFHGLFSIHNHKLDVAVTWGVAALVYLVIARLIARVIAR